MSTSILHHKIYLRDENSPWLVLIHGAGGSTSTWKFQIEDFRREFNLLVPDLRDHGGSKNIQPKKPEYSFELITSDLLHLIDHIGIKKASFMTLSFGSVLLQDLSMRRPGLLEKAVFAGAIFDGNLLLRTYAEFARLMNLFLPYQSMYNLGSYLLMPRKSHQTSREIYKRQAKKLTPNEYMRWVGLYAEFFRLLNRFQQQEFTYPALVAMGEQDYVFLKAAERFSETRSNVSLFRIPGAGHICNIDQPKQFNKGTLSFLNGS